MTRNTITLTPVAHVRIQGITQTQWEALETKLATHGIYLAPAEQTAWHLARGGHQLASCWTTLAKELVIVPMVSQYVEGRDLYLKEASDPVVRPLPELESGSLDIAALAAWIVEVLA